jgi:hypothetical protein
MTLSQFQLVRISRTTLNQWNICENAAAKKYSFKNSSFGPIVERGLIVLNNYHLKDILPGVLRIILSLSEESEDDVALSACR